MAIFVSYPIPVADLLDHARSGLNELDNTGTGVLCEIQKVDLKGIQPMHPLATFFRHLVSELSLLFTPSPLLLLLPVDSYAF